MFQSAEARGEGYGIVMAIVTVIALSKSADLPLNTHTIVLENAYFHF